MVRDPSDLRHSERIRLIHINAHSLSTGRHEGVLGVGPGGHVTRPLDLRRYLSSPAPTRLGEDTRQEYFLKNRGINGVTKGLRTSSTHTNP